MSSSSVEVGFYHKNTEERLDGEKRKKQEGAIQFI